MPSPSPSDNPSLDAALPAGETPSYEQAVAELDALVLAMESGQMPLDQLLQAYRRGTELLRHCRGQLEAVEQQVKVLENGEMKPWTGA